MPYPLPQTLSTSTSTVINQRENRPFSSIKGLLYTYASALLTFPPFIEMIQPNDVDVFMLMEDSFYLSKYTGEVRLLFFDHAGAQARFGASVFWMRHLAAFGDDEKTIEDWQVKRDGGQRGIVEITKE